MLKVNYQSSPEPEPSKKYTQVKKNPVDCQNNLQRETTAKRNSLYMCTDFCTTRTPISTKLSQIPFTWVNTLICMATPLGCVGEVGENHR